MPKKARHVEHDGLFPILRFFHCLQPANERTVV